MPKKKQPKNKFDLVEAPSLFDGLSSTEVAAILEELGDEARHSFAETSTAILTILRKNEPIAILTSMAWRFFVAQSRGASNDRWPAAQQHHLELLQAFALRHPLSAGPEDRRLADAVGEIIELLDTNTRAFSLTRIARTDTGIDNNIKSKNLLLNQIRGTTQVVRGEFNPYQLDYYLRSIFRRMRDTFYEIHGVEPSHLLDALQTLVKLIEQRLNDYRRRLHRVFRSHKPKKAIRAYFEAFPEDEPRRESILAKAVEKNVRPHLMRYFLVEEAERFLPSCYTIDEIELERICLSDGAGAALKKIFNSWSLEFGELGRIPLEHLYLANPVWERPFIKTNDNRLLWPTPGTFFAFAFEMFERLIGVDEKLKEKYENARSKMLEAELGILLKKYFPDGRIIEGLEWIDPLSGTKYENDAVVLIGRTALLFEAKSGKVSAEAKRGAEKRLQREINTLMVAPAQQSRRLMELLSQHPREHVFQSEAGEVTIDSKNIDRFIRVNITLNIIGTISSYWPDLIKAELIKPNEIQIPTMSIGDLDVIFGVLRDQATICHYLGRRVEFEKNANYFADEYDLLSFYLRNGFNIGDTEFDGTHLMIYGMSEALDRYFRRQPDDKQLNPPSPPRSKLFASTIAALEQRKPDHWLEATDMLLNVTYDDQYKISQGVAASISRVRKSRNANMSWTAIIANGPVQRRESIAFVWYKCSSLRARDERISIHAEQAMELANCNNCLVVGFDIERSTDVYSVIGIFNMPGGSS